MYTMADQSWHHLPRRMPRPVIDLAARRIAEHARTHDLPAVKVILHGGEPLLAGPDLIEYAVSSMRKAAGPGTRIDFTIQTNGVRLDIGYLDLFARLGVRVGVSVDGPASAQDRHRRYPDGRGSYRAVEAALRRLAAHPMRDDLFGGLLCTIDIDNDPVATYEALVDFSPPMIDLQLPHGNWATPPRGRVPGSFETPYANWLIAVFDRWYDAPRRETRVRLFGELMQAILGGVAGTEAIGLAPVAVVVIDTDGEIELSHSLKSAFRGAPFTGSHVARDTFDAVLNHPSVVARQLGDGALCDTCHACSLSLVCGAGHYAHRYQPGRGFANPSVYCPDLFRLITHVRDVMRADIAALGADRR
jgi:uncharacterized protein